MCVSVRERAKKREGEKREKVGDRQRERERERERERDDKAAKTAQQLQTAESVDPVSMHLCRH